MAGALQDKVVIVTGAGRGVGRYTASTFVREGARVVLADIHAERLQRAADELAVGGAEVLASETDVRDEAQVKALMEQAQRRWGRLDVLVNNAGIVTHFKVGSPRWPRVRDMDKSFWDRVLDTNLGGTFLCTKYALPYMEAQGSGHVINLYGGYSHPVLGNPDSIGVCAYTVSKHAIRTFTTYVAEEERPYNVCIVAVTPGAAIAPEDAPEEFRREFAPPSVVGDRFVLAAQVPMSLTGQLLTMENGELVAEGTIPGGYGGAPERGGQHTAEPKQAVP